MISQPGSKEQLRVATADIPPHVQLLIPLPDAFQMSPSGTLEDFIRRLYFAVGQAFIDNHELIKRGAGEAPTTRNGSRHKRLGAR